MKIMMSTMRGASYGVAYDTAGGGGGGAVATPPAPAAPAPAAAAPAAPPAAKPAAPAPSGKGVFANINAPAPVVPLPKKADAAPAPNTPAAPAAGDPNAPAPAGAPAPAAQPLAADTPFATPLLGRFKTPKEAEEGLRRSQDEGLRLHEENKSLKGAAEKAKADYEARVRALEAELQVARTTTPFRELSAEDVARLRKEDPAAYADYLHAKRDHDAAVQERKAQAEHQTQERTRLQAEVLRTIKERDVEMRRDKESYPQYDEMQPLMAQFADLTKVGEYSPLTGHPWSGEILYLAAMGHSYIQALNAGKGTSDAAAEAARAKAAADAAAGRAPGAGGGGGSGAEGNAADTAAKEHQAWKENVLAHAPKPLFGGGRKT